MEERRPRKRRPRPGFVLNAVCLIVILICFAIGGIQSVAARHQAEKQAAAEAAALQAQQEEERRLAEEQAAALEASKYDFTFSFMGDLNLADDWSPMQHLKARENGIEDSSTTSLPSPPGGRLWRVSGGPSTATRPTSPSLRNWA